MVTLIRGIIKTMIEFVIIWGLISGEIQIMSYKYDPYKATSNFHECRLMLINHGEELGLKCLETFEALTSANTKV